MSAAVSLGDGKSLARAAAVGCRKTLCTERETCKRSGPAGYSGGSRIAQREGSCHLWGVTEKGTSSCDLEEVCLHAHALCRQPQHRRDRVARRPLRRRARRHHLRCRAAARLRRRQPVAVDLGAARARPLAHAHHDRRHHVRWQRRRRARQRHHAPKWHRRAEAALTRRCCRTRHRHRRLRLCRRHAPKRRLRLPCLVGVHHLRRADVRDERVGVHQHHRLVDARQRAQRVLDLAQLDPLAAQLHLEVEPPAELELAVGVPAHAVARAIDDAAARRVGLGPRVGHEALVGELGPLEIAARHLHAAQPQLAPHADRLQQGR
eukprot:scaffold24380_cov63-Phaeocystis_antarctica.AAC.1